MGHEMSSQEYLEKVKALAPESCLAGLIHEVMKEMTSIEFHTANVLVESESENANLKDEVRASSQAILKTTRQIRMMLGAMVLYQREKGFK